MTLDVPVVLTMKLAPAGNAEPSDFNTFTVSTLELTV